MIESLKAIFHKILFRNFLKTGDLKENFMIFSTFLANNLQSLFFSQQNAKIELQLYF